MKDIKLSYPFSIVEEKQDSGEIRYLVSFRDLSGCITDGTTREEATAMAKEALDLYLESLLEEGMDIPKPSKARKNELLISPSLNITVPILLRFAREAEGKSLTNVAASLETPYQNYQSLEKGKRKNITVGTLNRAFNALGYDVEIVLHHL